jgi:sulfur carrier protein
MAKIQLNGRKLELGNKYSIARLLKKYKIDSKKIAIELNGKIINRSKYKLIYIKNKDKIEIVYFIGGG